MGLTSPSHHTLCFMSNPQTVCCQFGIAVREFLKELIASKRIEHHYRRVRFQLVDPLLYCDDAVVSEYALCDSGKQIIATDDFRNVLCDEVPWAYA